MYAPHRYEIMSKPKRRSGRCDPCSIPARTMSNVGHDAGHGNITAQIHNNRVVFPVLSYTYPLKLLSPRVQQDGVAIVYMITYGGGLVGGDCISLSVNIEQDAQLVFLSQVRFSMSPMMIPKLRPRSLHMHNRGRRRCSRLDQVSEPPSPLHPVH